MSSMAARISVLPPGTNIEKGQYQPDITSCDYAAPINEQGKATAAFHRYP